MDSAPPITPQPPELEPQADSALAVITPPATRWRVHMYAIRSLIWLLIAAFLWISFVGGLRLRRFAWETSDSIRFVFDMKRNVFWALAGSGPEGMLNQYEKMAPELPEWQDPNWVPWFDYGPLRMLVMKCWGVWIRHHHPPGDDPWTEAWQSDYEYTAPVLHFNTAMELLASIFAFFLTRLWIRRGARSNRGPTLRVCGDRSRRR